MTIILKLELCQLIAINNMMTLLDSIRFESQPRPLKSMVAICFELRETLLKKAISKRLSTKAFKIELPYYKADALWRFLDEFYIMFEFDKGSFEENVWRMISNELHQKLL